MYRFRVEDQVYAIPVHRIRTNSFLSLLVTKVGSMKVEYEKDDDGIIIEISDLTKDDFDHVDNYLNRGVYPPKELLPLFDYLGQSLFNDYEISSLQEIEMRTKMYLPEFKEHSMNTDPYFNLVKIDQELWESLRVARVPDNNLLFQEKIITNQSWDQIQTKLEELKRITAISPNYFIAGGRIFSALFGTESNDIDIFLHSCNAKQAEQLLFEFYLGINKSLDRIKDYSATNVTRTKNTVTFNIATHNTSTDYQFVLRIYQTPSEVLHGFDVDSCCFGFDGTNIWATQRALYAITHGYNTVNFDRLSPSYEYRLIKYGTRGMAVKVPNFTRDNVNTKELQARWDRFLERTTVHDRYGQRSGYGSMVSRYQDIKTTELPPTPVREDKVLYGLDKLLYLEFHCRSYNYNKRTLRTVGKLTEESSDYCPVPYTHGYGTGIEETIEYLIDSADWHSEAATKYLAYLDTRFNNIEKIAIQFSTNNIPVAPSMSFLKVHCNYRNGIEILQVFFNIPERIYRGLEVVRPWTVPQRLEFKITNPGEQMTGTFHRTVLEDHQLWYQGKYYKY